MCFPLSCLRPALLQLALSKGRNMKAQDLAQSVNYSGDAIAQIFIDALTQCNFHQEADIICKAWEAMAFADTSDRKKLASAVIKSLKG